MRRPLITHLRRLSMDDGPGLRTTVFMKGCPLSCTWCHNPENIRPGTELVFFQEQCINCGDCLAVCPEDALTGLGRPHVRRERCTACGRCADACPTTALHITGRYYTVEELVALILRDREFYAASGGGVTFSGGEPTLYLGYLARTLRRLKSEGLHVAIETAGTFAWKTFAATVLPHLDLVLYDLKLLDPAEHRRHAGRGNERILANFIRLCEETTVEVVPRVPLIPRISATSGNLEAVARFVSGRRCRPLQLLPYNPAVHVKLRALGRDPGQALPENPMSAAEIRNARAIAAAALHAGARQ